MKLRRKLLFLILVTSVICILAITWIADRVIMSSYLSLEEENAALSTERIMNGVDLMIHRLDAITVDWAYWDDTDDFIDNQNEDYVKRNITDSTFYETKMEYLIIQDEDFKTILKRKYDLQSETFATVPDEVLNTVSKYQNQTGLLWIDNHAIVVSTLNVKDSEAEKEGRGLFVFGYDFNDQAIEALRDSLIADIQIKQNMPLNNQRIVYENLENVTNATFQVPYLNTETAMEVTVVLENKISNLGRDTVKNFIVLVVMVFLIFSGALFMALRNIVVRRLSKLSFDVYQISHNEDLSRRLSIEGNDEISELKDDVNFMLEKIENMNEEITELATYDNMTGALNRRAGFNTLETLIAVSKKTNTPLCIGYIDVNNLKIVNDRFGHNEGDRLIKDVIEILTKSIRQSDRICRLGGDEFLLIFPQEDYMAVKQIFSRVDENILKFNAESGRAYEVGISKGIAIYDYGMTVDEFVEIADKRMYSEKQYRKNKYSLSD